MIATGRGVYGCRGLAGNNPQTAPSSPRDSDSQHYHAGPMFKGSSSLRPACSWNSFIELEEDRISELEDLGRVGVIRYIDDLVANQIFWNAGAEARTAPTSTCGDRHLTYPPKHGILVESSRMESWCDLSRQWFWMVQWREDLMWESESSFWNFRHCVKRPPPARPSHDLAKLVHPLRGFHD